MQEWPDLKSFCLPYNLSILFSSPILEIKTDQAQVYGLTVGAVVFSIVNVTKTALQIYKTIAMAEIGITPVAFDALSLTNDKYLIQIVNGRDTACLFFSVSQPMKITVSLICVIHRYEFPLLQHSVQYLAH